MEVRREDSYRLPQMLQLSIDCVLYVVLLFKGTQNLPMFSNNNEKVSYHHTDKQNKQ